MLEYCSLWQAAPTDSHRNRKNTICKFITTEPISGWRWHFLGSHHYQRWDLLLWVWAGMWSGKMWIPHQRRSSRCSPQQVKWCAVSFGVGREWSFWVSWNPDRPSILTATSQLWLSWRLRLPDSGQLRRQPFSCNTVTPGTTSIWRPWSTLPALAGLSYHTYHVVWIRALWFPFLWTDER